MKEKPKIKQRSKVNRIKDLIHAINRADLSKVRMQEAINDVTSLIIKERFKEEELLELKTWIGRKEISTTLGGI